MSSQELSNGNPVSEQQSKSLTNMPHKMINYDKVSLFARPLLYNLFFILTVLIAKYKATPLL